MPKPYPEEFRQDVVRVARNRGPGVTVEQVATDLGVHPMTLGKWKRRADIDDGAKPGTTSQENAELREAGGLQGLSRTSRDAALPRAGGGCEFAGGDGRSSRRSWRRLPWWGAWRRGGRRPAIR
ncbi:transposase [Streptomyces sp. NPDC006879]|uniref:transposase n=1 Tax=Streptomyces sp. NPDC006879 TaxID=3364767 RepID=UPI0036C8956E